MQEKQTFKEAMQEKQTLKEAMQETILLIQNIIKESNELKT